jgi:hypothetical protein
MVRMLVVAPSLAALATLCVACAAPPPEIEKGDKYLRDYYIGKSFTTDSVVFSVCTLPYERYQYQNECDISMSIGKITVSDIVETGYLTYAKITLGNGLVRYITYEDLRKIEQALRPPPRIGMSKDEALDTNWGSPEKRNITSIPGHRSEQWVFPNRGYLYIEDETLTSIQRTE